MGISAEGFKQLRDSNDDKGIDRIYQNAKFQEYSMVIRAKTEVYNHELRARYDLMRLTPKNYRKENEWLLRRLDAFRQQFAERPFGDISSADADALFSDHENIEDKKAWVGSQDGGIESQRSIGMAGSPVR